MTIFNFTEYKDYLNHTLSTSGAKRGIRSQLAKELGCQTGFISQVLNGDVHFSLEHGIKISNFLSLSTEEKDFFLLLINYARAGSYDLQMYYKNLVEQSQKEHNEIKNRINVISKITEKDYAKYYGQWYYSAIHVLISIPGFQSIKPICEKLHLSYDIVNDVLNFLESKNLISKVNDYYQLNNFRMHIDRQSPLIVNHHTNWRLEAMKSLDAAKENDLHYSSALTMSKQDYMIIKHKILNLLSDIEPILRDSPEEEIYSLCLDFFQVGR